MSIRNRSTLRTLLEALRAAGDLPDVIDVAPIGPCFAARIESKRRSCTGIMPTRGVTGGIGRTPDEAVLKALTELIERSAYETWTQTSAPAFGESTGVAAFPRGLFRNGEERARRHAFAEAVERHAWIEWWERDDVASEVVSRSGLPASVQAFVEFVERSVGFSRIAIVAPRVETSLRLLVFYGLFEGGGCTAGAACGLNREIETIALRALNELYQHGRVSKLLMTKRAEPSNEYEALLAYFASGEGDASVAQKLRRVGRRALTLPDLDIDETLQHPLQRAVSVHACRLRGQRLLFEDVKEPRLCI